tara:strand:- start:223 stop:792 length:570 start_codon:yes stop_codon:yes gene_type:complete
MKEAFETVKGVLSPEDNWSKFAMKITGLAAVAGIGLFGFNLYKTAGCVVEEEEDYEVGIEEVFLEEPEKEEEVNGILDRLTRQNRDINSVWLYDWPDARNIVPIAGIPRNSEDPLPSGYWMKGDEQLIGSFVLGRCAKLNREFISLACPIMGASDAWGVLVVTYRDGSQTDRLPIIAAKKISEVIYLLE